MVGGFRGFSYGYPGRFGHQYPQPPEEGDWRLGCALAIGTVLTFILLTYPHPDNNATKTSTTTPPTQEQNAQVSGGAPDLQEVDANQTRNSTSKLVGVLVVMANIVVVWGFILYRYHDKFPILKHQDLTWRGPFRHP